MNDGYRYEQEPYVTQNPEHVAASRAEIIHKLSRVSLSAMELIALSRFPYDITNSALHQLESQHAIRKMYATTDQQNVIVGYELVV
ncbi:hypothetical protein KC953_02120 [Candidatus Saccharibacteria bacterium]|nr:hypothetical protein [Candidatus Saccharibacteria bacterium]